MLQKAFCIFGICWIAVATKALEISYPKVSQNFDESYGPNLYEICPDAVTYDSSGTLTSPKYDGANHYGPIGCYFYIYFPAGINIQINVNDLYTYSTSTSYGYLQIHTSNTTSSWPTLVTTLAGTYGAVNYTYNLQNNARIYFNIYSSSYYGRFRLTWKAMPVYPISPSLRSDCQGPDVLFLLDRSQAIFPDFYNNTIKSFLQNMTSQYSFLDDITPQNPFSSRFGVIEFSDDATVSIPLVKYSRTDFFWRLQNNTGYGNGGDSNVTAALLLAYDEFWQHGTPDDGSYRTPKVIVLVVNDISPFDLKPATVAMTKLKQLVQLPIGVIVPGLPGIVPGSQTRLANLTGSAAYTFGSLDAGVIGIPALTNSTFSCPVCSNLIFICEMTSAIGWETKLQCLQLAQKLAIAASHNYKRRYAIALFGVEIYHSIVMQDFLEFNDTINQMIQDAEDNNKPNGGQTYLAPILNQLYTILGNTTTSSKYATLIMGELSVIRDPPAAFTAAQNIAKLNSDIYVLDDTRYGSPSNLWTTLTKSQPNHIVNGTSTTDIGELFLTFDQTLLQDLEKIQC